MNVKVLSCDVDVSKAEVCATTKKNENWELKLVKRRNNILNYRNSETVGERPTRLVFPCPSLNTERIEIAHLISDFVEEVSTAR